MKLIEHLQLMPKRWAPVALMFLISLNNYAQSNRWREEPNYEDCLARINTDLYPEVSFQAKDLFCQLESATKSADYESADVFLSTLDSMLAREPDSVFIMMSTLEIGKLHGMQGRYELAFLSYSESLAYFKRQRSYNDWGLALVRLAEYYRDLQRYDLAQSHLELAIDLEKNHGPFKPQTLAVLWHRYAAISLEMQRPVEEAISYSERSLSYSEPNGLKEDMATSYLELGYIYYNIKDARAESYYREALMIWRQLGLVHYETNTLFNLARMYYSLGDPETAEELLGDVLTLCDSLHLNSVLHNALYLKSEVSVANGKYQEAMELRDQAYKIKLEQMLNQHDIAIAQISKKYESDLTIEYLRIAKLDVLEAEQDAGKQKERQLFFAALLLIVAGLMVMLFVFYRRLQYRSNEVIEQQ